MTEPSGSPGRRTLSRRNLLRLAAIVGVGAAVPLVRHELAGDGSLEDQPPTAGSAPDVSPPSTAEASTPTPVPAGASTSTPVPAEVVDAPIIRAINYPAGSDPSAIAKLIDMDVQAVRMNFEWNRFQPEAQHRWDDRFTPWVDSVLPGFTRREVKVLVGLVFSPEWANGGQGKDSRNFSDADFCTFIEDVHERWGEHIEAYEIWNEPALDGFLQGTVDEKATRYAQLLQAAYPCIKALDPTKPVLGASLYQPVWDNQRFLTTIYELGAGGSFDILSQHMYGDNPGHAKGYGSEVSPVPFRTMFDAVSSQTIETMRRFGDGDKPIWITETGVNTSIGGEGQPEAVQAELLAEAYSLLAEGYVPNVERLYWYHLADNGSFDPAEPENRFGIISLEGGAWRTKPAFDVLAATR